MELSYEETMRRIDEHEKQYAQEGLNHKLCRKVPFPYHVHLYKGEDQIIVVPLTASIGYYHVEMEWHRQITDFNDMQLIGDTVLDAIEHIKKSPVDARTPIERSADSIVSNATKCNTYNEFEKKYLFCIVVFYENESYLIYPGGHNERKCLYPCEEKKIPLPAKSTNETIGQSIMLCFEEMENFYKGRRRQKKTIPRFEFETLSDIKVSFEIPQDERYNDEEDYGAAEIYQGYSFYKSEDDEKSTADMFFGIAAELDCDLSSENVLKVFEKQYGKADEYNYTSIEHSVFQFRAEILGKNVHRVLYLKQIDSSELLSCELTIDTKRAGKRLYNKLIKDFEKLIGSCNVIEE